MHATRQRVRACMVLKRAAWLLSCGHSPKRWNSAMLAGVTVLTRTSGAAGEAERGWSACASVA